MLDSEMVKYRKFKHCTFYYFLNFQFIITHQGFVSTNLDMIQFSYIRGGAVQTGIQEEKKLFC